MSAEPDDARINALRERIRRAFPASPYHGAITPGDDAHPWPEELDDEKFLYDALKDRSWTDVSSDFVYQFHGEWILLTPEAYAAFIPAWLTRSLDNMEGKNLVRDFLVYPCSPPGISWKLLSPLNAEQRSVFRDLVAEFAERERSRFVREQAIKALARIDELLAAGHYVPYHD